jgi:hypothetical protein
MTAGDRWKQCVPQNITIAPPRRIFCVNAVSFEKAGLLSLFARNSGA